MSEGVLQSLDSCKFRAIIGPLGDSTTFLTLNKSCKENHSFSASCKIKTVLFEKNLEFFILICLQISIGINIYLIIIKDFIDL